MVECAALEMRYTGNRIEGSNPSLSAIISRICLCRSRTAQLWGVISFGSFAELLWGTEAASQMVGILPARSCLRLREHFS